MGLFTIYTIPPFISSILFLILGSLVFLKNKKSLANLLFFIVCFVTFWWQFSWFFLFNINNYHLAASFVKIGYVGIIFLPVSFFHFFISFLNHSGKTDRIILYVSYFLSFLFETLLIFSNYFISGYYVYFWGFYPEAGILHPIYLIFLSLLTLRMLFLLFTDLKSVKEIDVRKYKQEKYILLAFIFYIFASSDFLINYGVEFYPLGFIFILVFLGIVAYAIIRYQLLDIRIVIQRGVIYSVSLSIIVGFYIALVLVLGLVLQQASEITALLAAGITTILGIYGVPFIEKYFRRWSDKIFFKDKYDYSKAVFEISEVLNENINLRALIVKIAQKLDKILKVKFVEVIIPGYNLKYDRNRVFKPLGEIFPVDYLKIIQEQKLTVFNYSDILYLLEQAERKNDVKTINQLKALEHYGKKYNIALSVAIVIEDKLFGIITLGEKRSGDIFNSDDNDLLKTLSHQAAVALEKADLYEQVKSYSEELERKVEKRTAKIKSLQEGQKQMMLEIAHGLQTPLTIIKGELNNLYDQIKDNKKIIALEKTIDRTSKFIYDMLRIANFEASSKKLELDPLSLSELLLELIEGFEIVTQDKNIKIISKIEPGVYIKGDKGSLEELMSNLVSNSVKYMKKEGERKIIIELTKRNKQAVLKIADNGIGIDKKFLPKIFNRFYRVNDKKEEQREGAGLGLAICQRIVLAHQGRISVASKVGQGTEFTIIFPLL